MNIETLKSLYINYCNKFSEEEAFDKLVDKYPDMIGDLCMIRSGDDEVPSEMKFQADETFFDEEVNDIDTEVKLVEPAVKHVDEEVNVESVNETKPKTENKVNVDKKEKAVSKSQLAYQMYVEAVDKTRKVMINRFVEELGLTNAGASTYVQNCKKKFESQQAQS